MQSKTSDGVQGQLKGTTTSSAVKPSNTTRREERTESLKRHMPEAQQSGSVYLHWEGLLPLYTGLTLSLIAETRYFNLVTSIVLGYTSWHKEFESAYGQLIGETTRSPQYNPLHLPRETSFICFNQKSAAPPVMWLRHLLWKWGILFPRSVWGFLGSD